MPRPTTKQELLLLSEKNFNALLDFINSLPEEYKIKEYKNDELNNRDKTISDIIMHLYEWHNMVETWYTVGMKWEKPDIPWKWYTWKTLPAYNRTIWEKYKNTPLTKAIELFWKSHKKIMNMIEKHSDEELFTRWKYKWTWKNNVWAYFIWATSSHYDWALKTLKPIKKLIKQ